MQRVTITVDDGLMDDIDRLVAARGYQNRSEVIRDLARAGLQQAAVETEPGQPCVAALVYTFDHGRRDLSKRLTDTFHHNHAMAVSTLHVHLDDAQCLEVTILKGSSDEVRHFADHVIAERGLRHGQLVVLPAAAAARSHPHQDAATDAV